MTLGADCLPGGLGWTRKSGHRPAKLSYGGGVWERCSGSWLRDQGRSGAAAGKDANFGIRNGRRSTPRSVAEWSAEPGVEDSEIRCDLPDGEAGCGVLRA